MATDILIHNLEEGQVKHWFNYDEVPLYCCSQIGISLEETARTELERHFCEISRSYMSIMPWALKGKMSHIDHAIVHVNVPCCCGLSHKAIFYTDFLANGQVPNIDEFLLAEISRTSLVDHLNGLCSKTEFMGYLEKLIIRWHLSHERIIIATPFVGHQYMSKESKLEIWNWLLSILDPQKVIFVTRGKEYSTYKSVLDEVEGLDYGLLEEYALENKLIAANIRKQDFHAKFYAAISPAGCEVLSGSANIVSGPSIENIAFHELEYVNFQHKYLSKLNLDIAHIEGKENIFVVTKFIDNKWCAKEGRGKPLA